MDVIKWKGVKTRKKRGPGWKLGTYLSTEGREMEADDTARRQKSSSWSWRKK